MSRRRRITVTDDGLLKFVSVMLVTALVLTLAGRHGLELIYTIVWTAFCIEAVILLVMPIYVVITNHRDLHNESDPCEDFPVYRGSLDAPAVDPLVDLDPPTVRFQAPARGGGPGARPPAGA